MENQMSLSFGDIPSVEFVVVGNVHSGGDLIVLDVYFDFRPVGIEVGYIGIFWVPRVPVGDYLLDYNLLVCSSLVVVMVVKIIFQQKMYLHYLLSNQE
jgi:hypothetical protein